MLKGFLYNSALSVILSALSVVIIVFLLNSFAISSKLFRSGRRKAVRTGLGVATHSRPLALQYVEEK